MQRALVLDSGVGGLSVARAIRAALPELAIVYLADNAWFPYGKRSESALIERLVHLVDASLRAYACDVVVVACNTASTIVLDALRAHFALPIVGVVPPIKTAGEVSQTRVVGLLATEATVTRPYVGNLIAQFAQDCQIISIGSPRLAEIAEEKIRGEPVCLDELRGILEPFFGASAPAVDTVVLGCTHYPLLIDALRAVSPRRVRWLDSAPAVARHLAQVLHELPDSDAHYSDVVLFTAASQGAHHLGDYLRQLHLPAPQLWAV